MSKKRNRRRVPTAGLRRRHRDRTSPRLRVESMESRTLLASTIVLDFTPDAIPGEYTVGRFANLFDPARNPTLTAANRFLDYDGNGAVNFDDATEAARRIAGHVRTLFKP